MSTPSTPDPNQPQDPQPGQPEQVPEQTEGQLVGEDGQPVDAGDNPTDDQSGSPV